MDSEGSFQNLRLKLLSRFGFGSGAIKDSTVSMSALSSTYSSETGLRYSLKLGICDGKLRGDCFECYTSYLATKIVKIKSMSFMMPEVI